MSSDKNNIFIQLYKPIDPVAVQAPTQQSPQTGQPTPEHDPFTNQLPSEFAPIYEYVEPQIDPALSQHVQNANPQYVPQKQLPITPTLTPPIPGIQPMKIPTIPLSDLEVEKELKTDVYSAIRWLAEWCLRQIQINKPDDSNIKN